MNKKQTLYEKIKIIVESWNIAICQFDNWDYILFSSMFYRWEGKTPYIRSSNRWNDINNCYQSLWASYETRYNIDKRNLRYIWIYERPLRRPDIWQKVQVLHKWLKLNNYSDQRKDIAWWSLEVFWLKDWTCIIKCTEYDYLEVPYDCIAPRVEIDTI
jgi:hypothetical protein